MSLLQVIVLAIIQGLAELLPISSSAHVVVAEKLMGLDPSSPAMTLLLVMLHTGTMFAVIVYFWKQWKATFFSDGEALKRFVWLAAIATVLTGIVGEVLIKIIEHTIFKGYPHAQIEDLFGHLGIVAPALLAAGILILAGLGYGAYRWLAPGSGSNIDSLAVLPFTNVTADPNADYLSDGLTESLIGDLSRLPNLTVRPRSSVFRYKAKDLDLQKVASELQVNAVVTGRVTQHGDSLIVSAELTDTRKNRSLWSDQYDRKLSDALSVQREISDEISARLREKLTGEQKTQLAKGGTNDSDAYGLYLKGRYYWDKRTPDGLAKAKDYFQQAIDKDPNYAQAYVGLAEYYSVLPVYTNASNAEMNPKAIAAAKKALAIDETLAEAHASLASSEDLNWDWDASEREFRRALELNPNSARTHVLYAIHLEFLGKLQETLENVRRAIELDPLNLNGIDNLAEAYIYTGQYAESIEQSKKIVEIDPAFANVYSHLADAYRLTGQYELWLEAEEKVATLSDEPGRLSVVKAMKEEYAKSGFRGALKREAELVEEASKHTYIDPALLASIYGMLGDKDKAFAWLEKAYAEKSAFISYIKVARDYDSLRSDPRYTNLLKRMGLPQ